MLSLRISGTIFADDGGQRNSSDLTEIIHEKYGLQGRSMIEFEQNGIRVKIPESLRDDYLSFGQIGLAQRALRQDVNRLEVFVDFAGCEWADPLPLMVLLAEFAIWRLRFPKTSLILNLGAYGTADHSKRQARLRKFLLNHGFIDAFAKHAGATIRFDQNASGQAQDYQYDDLKHIRDRVSAFSIQGVPLSYDSAELVSADALTFSLADPVQTMSISDFVDDLVRSADRQVFYQRPSIRSSRDTTLQRMRHILLELVRNVWEHAYRKTDQHQTHGAVAVFARLRRPHHNSRSNQIGKEDHPTATAEIQHCPRIQLVRDRADALQVELFVCDVGQGLTSDIPEWIKVPHLQGTTELNHLSVMRPGTEQWKYPLRHIDSLLFASPLSRHDRTSSITVQERGTLTGLQYLRSVLGYHRDVSRISVGTEWISRAHQQDSSSPKPPSDADPDYSGESALGTFIHVALIVQQTPTLSDKGWADIGEEQWTDYRTELIKGLAKSVSPVKVWAATDVLDLRAAEKLETHQEPAKLQQQAREAFDAFGASPIVRTRRNFEKNLIYQVMDAWLGSSCPSAADLIISDMSRFQALMVDRVVSSFHRRYERQQDVPHLNNRKLVLLMTEDFASKLYRVVLTDVQGLKHVHIENVPIVEDVPRRPGTLLKLTRMQIELMRRHLRVANQLRILDSQRFWDRIEWLQKIKDQPVLLGPVEWASGVILPRYLNFSLAAHDAGIASILRRALRRLIALFPECRTESLDNLIDAELHDANKWLIGRATERTHVPRLLVGSVLVSGATVNKQSPTNEFDVAGILHALIAPTATSSNPGDLGVPSLVALLWMRKERDKTGTDVQYIRIPDTPYISKISDTLLPIGRVHHRDDIVGTTPAEMYRTFFRNRLIKIGHWKYGSRHSLIDINAVSVLEASADTNHGFYAWLAKQFEQIASNDVIVGYPVQRLATSIARTIEKKLPSSLNQKAVKWVPLHYLPSSGGALVRLSPLSTDLLNTYVKVTAPDVHFCFLDVGVVSNRTFRHTRRQARALGIKNVTGFVLQNRTSWPTLIPELDREQGRFQGPNSFWRWGLPVFGGANSCALCGGLAGLPQLRALVEKRLPDIAATLDRIQEQWSSQDLGDAWNECGLEPEILLDPVEKKLGFLPTDALRQEELTVKYKLVSDTKKRPVKWHMVEHECSTTLASHAIEVAAATHRFSYPLGVATKIDKGKDKKKKLTPTVALEIQVCALLLLGKDMTLRQQYDYADAILATLFDINVDGGPAESSLRREKLLGLTVVALMGIRPAVKRAVSKRLLNGLAMHDIVDPALRTPLIVLTRDTSEGKGVYQFFQDALKARLEIRHEDQIGRRQATYSPLARNAIRMGLQKMTHKEAWLRLDQFFARGPSHEGRAMQAVIAATNLEKNTGSALGKTFSSLVVHAAYQPLFANARDIVSVLGSLHVLGLFNSNDLKCLENDFAIWARPDLAMELAINPIDAYLLLVKRARQMVWKSLVRFEVNTKIASVFCAELIGQKLNWSNPCAVFQTSNSLPICRQLHILISEIISNAEKQDIETEDPWLVSTMRKKHWISASCSGAVESGSYLSMEIKNEYVPKDGVTAERAKLETSFLESIGGSCVQDSLPPSEPGGRWYYSVRMKIPYLSSMQKDGAGYEY